MVIITRERERLRERERESEKNRERGRQKSKETIYTTRGRTVVGWYVAKLLAPHRATQVMSRQEAQPENQLALKRPRQDDRLIQNSSSTSIPRKSNIKMGAFKWLLNKATPQGRLRQEQLDRQVRKTAQNIAKKLEISETGKNMNGGRWSHFFQTSAYFCKFPPIFCTLQDFASIHLSFAGLCCFYINFRPLTPFFYGRRGFLLGVLQIQS